MPDIDAPSIAAEDDEQDEQQRLVRFLTRAVQGGGGDGGGRQAQPSAPPVPEAAAPAPVPQSAGGDSQTPKRIGQGFQVAGRPNANRTGGTPGDTIIVPVVPPAPKPGVQPTPETARQLGDFHAATGTTAQSPAPPPSAAIGKVYANETAQTPAPPPTHLAQTEKDHPAPTPPVMGPDYAKTQADLRAKSAVTPKYDPATGKVLEQYQPSMRARIGRAFLDAGRGFLYGGLGGAIAAPLEGAFGNKNAPGYYGRGAVNSQYGRDEQARQQAVAADTAKIGSFEAQQKEAQTQFKDQNDVYKDVMGTAYKQDIEDQKAKYQQDTTDLKQQAQDLKEQLRSIIYDPATGKFMRGDQVYAPKDFQEGAVLEVNNGITTFDANGKIVKAGPQTNMWLKERKNQPIHVHTGDKELSARDRLKINAYKRANGIKTDADLDPDQLDEALSAKPAGGEWAKNPQEAADYKERTTALDREATTLESRKALYTEGGTADTESQAALKRLNDRLTAINQEKEAVKQQIIQNRPAKKGNAGGQPKLTPIPDKSMKTAGGKVYNIGDKVPGRGTIKSFSKGDDGKTYANF
jgi:hypothetical protein